MDLESGGKISLWSFLRVRVLDTACNDCVRLRVPAILPQLLSGVIALKFVPFTFLTAPVSVALWFMCMDFVPVIASFLSGNWTYWEVRVLAAEVFVA
jgi:hypothetical protein